MAALPAFTRSGAGPTLILLSGLGGTRHAWAPVRAILDPRFDVIAVDLPGFGDSAPLPPGVEPRPAALAAAVAELLDEVEIPSPRVAGNSLGGWVALELAQLRPVASLTLLSPAGLWAKNTPRYARVSLRVTRGLARRAGRPLSWLVSSRLGRVLVLGQTHGRPAGIPAAQARAAIRAMGTCAGFDATLQATLHRRYLAGPPIDAPVTLAFGSRDRLLLRRQSRHVDQLPSHTELADLPGCGHVPLLDDPAAVAGVIAATAERGAPVRASGAMAAEVSRRGGPGSRRLRSGPTASG